MMNYSGCPNQQAIVRRSHPAQPGGTFDWSANFIAYRLRAPEGGYIPNPNGRDLGLGYRVRTLPLGRDRWGRYSTKGGYILPEPIWTIFLNLYLRDAEKRRTSFQSESYQISSKINSKKSCFLLNEIKNLTGIIRLFTIKFVFLQRDSVSLK